MHEFKYQILRITNAKKSGERYVGHCPCHDDKTPSLSIRFIEGLPNPLIHCFAGCEKWKLINHLIQLELWSFKDEQ